MHYRPSTAYSYAHIINFRSLMRTHKQRHWLSFCIFSLTALSISRGAGNIGKPGKPPGLTVIWQPIRFIYDILSLELLLRKKISRGLGYKIFIPVPLSLSLSFSNMYVMWFWSRHSSWLSKFQSESNSVGGFFFWRSICRVRMFYAKAESGRDLNAIYAIHTKVKCTH